MVDKMRKAQVTIFIIIAILIISIIALFLIFRSGVVPGTGRKPEINPNVFLESCMEDKIKEAVEIISSQGGSMEPTLYKTFRFSDELEYRNIAYLCYNQNDYLPCVNQEPMLIQHLKDEIKNEVEADVENCFDSLTTSLDDKGYVVDARYKGFEVKLMPRKVVIEIKGEITLTKTGETSRHEDFKVIIPTRFYDLAIVAHEIINQETEFCNFDYVGFMILYPKFDIEKIRTGESIIIYTIKHRDTKEKFRFAIRGCAIPPGF